MNIQKGDLVILNNTECPSPRLIVLVTSVRKGTVYGEYVSRDISFKRPWCASGETTKVSDFGVEMRVEGDRLIATQTRPSEATYLIDGAPRKWQPCGQNSTLIKPRLLEAVNAALKSSNALDSEAPRLTVNPHPF